ncbi:hypothetical protein [Nocardia xishanensis]|uniref:hypothetical protein n=1 Tax=Nocardia xishanensis TaxID=238964 RepID=UPI00082D7159|nr:hypothetical protein [Nocardia xishanensis]
MTIEAERTTPSSISIRQAFRELDSYLTEQNPAYHYDDADDLAELKRRISAATEPYLGNQRQTADCIDIALTPGIVDPHVRALIIAYAESLDVTALRITNPSSALFAARLADGIHGQRWILSWLPGKFLTREQVISAMVLDQILIDHELDSTTMLQAMRLLAATLDLPLEDILARISMAKKHATNMDTGGWVAYG